MRRRFPTGRFVTMSVLSLVWIYPFVWMVSTSLKDMSEAMLGGASLIPTAPTLDNYSRAWSDGGFDVYSVNTVVIAVSVASLVVITSALAGYALSRGAFAGKRVVTAVLVATLFLPRGYTILPVFLLINALGLNNSLLGIILAESGPAHVIAILLFAGYFGRLPAELEEAARMDGAGIVRTFAQVMLPLARPVVVTVFIMTFLAAWNSFLIPLVFSLGNPDLRTLGVGTFAFRGEYSVDFGGLAAASVISVAPIIAIFLVLQRHFVDGIAGAVKS